MRRSVILHLGDSHFEEGSRWEECLRVHQAVVDIAGQVQPDVIAHCGDLYDKASTPTERLEACGIVRQLAELAPFFGVKGNHDRQLEMQLLARLRSRHPIRTCEATEVVGIGELGIAMMAWPSFASEFDDALQTKLENVFRGFGQELSAYRNRLLIAHLMADGAVTSTGQPLIGHAMNIPLAAIDLAGAHATVLGHVHKPQTLREQPAPILYTGSPFRTTYGELEDKSVTLVIIEDGVARCERIPTPARPMLHVDGHWEPAESGNGLVIALSLEQARAFKGADIRLRYTVPSEYREAARASAEATKARWLSEGAASVKVEAETVTSSRSRAPQVAAAKTLPEKIEALWESRGDRPEAPRDARILGRLGQLEAQP